MGEEKSKAKWSQPTKATPKWVADEWANTYLFDFREAELRIARAIVTLSESDSGATEVDAELPQRQASVTSPLAYDHTHDEGVAQVEARVEPAAQQAGRIVEGQTRQMQGGGRSTQGLPTRPEEAEASPGCCCPPDAGLSHRPVALFRKI